MKLIVKGRYHNNPAELHFDVPGIVEVDDKKAEYLLRDAPDNFAIYAPPVAESLAKEVIERADGIDAQEAKDLDAPLVDKMLKEPKKKK